MFKRLIALLLACVLTMGTLCAWAEPECIAIDGESTPGEIDTVVDAGDLFLSIDDLGTSLLANDDGGEEALLPTELTIKKSVTKKVKLGVDYQVKIPGKKIKRCSSSNKKIATVTDKGLIHTKKAGEVRITITPKKGDRIKLKLKVIDPTVPTAVAINEGARATLVLGGTKQLTATVSPDTAPQTVTWKSSNTVVATVDEDGLVTALTPGQATISAVTGNKLKAQLTVKVYRTASGRYMISHAMGGIDGYNYSNCLEGFLENYEEGHRIFEVDMELTSDGKIVLWHGWNRQFCSKYRKDRTPTYAEFMGSRIYDKYTPMDLEALLKLMDQYPDVRIITDSKHSSSTTVKKQFKAIVSTADRLGIPEVLDRFIVELYTKDMYKVVEGIHHFKEYILTLYKLLGKAPSKSRLQNLASFCRKNGINTIAMYAKWWNPKYTGYVKSYGIDLALYTVNDPDEAQEYFNEGVNALFTDFLPPLD